MFIESVTLRNFKKFENYAVSCRQANVLVGPNNAGKSSFLDSLRLVADVLKFSKQNNPSLRDHPQFGVCASYTLSDRNLSIAIENVVRNYGEDPAQIDYRLKNGNALQICIHPNDGLRVFLKTEAALPRSANAFRRLVGFDVVVIPTLSALEDQELVVKPETVRRNEFTRLASRNFRNILMGLGEDDFNSFANLVRDGWKDIEVRRPEIVGAFPPHVAMMYAEDRVDREIFWSGFGFQIWCQLMLQFVRRAENAILVIDEPDIYLHPDLQRKLLSIAKDRFAQLFLATHSTEIINEADPGDICMIESSGRSARRITSDEGYRRVYSYLGSSENAEFARLAKAKRIVFFEGKERTLVKKFAKKVGLGRLLDDPQTIYLQAGGFSQWRRVKEFDWALHEIFGLEAKIGALFDRDYRSEEEAEAFVAELKGEDLWVGVLARKEIENYALVLDPIVRTIVLRTGARGTPMDYEATLQLLRDTSQPFYDDCRAHFATDHLRYHKPILKGVDDSQHIKEAMARLDRRWSNLEQRLMIVPGKEFIAAISGTLQRDHGVSLTIHQILDEMTAEEVDGELVSQLQSLATFFTEEG